MNYYFIKTNGHRNQVTIPTAAKNPIQAIGIARRFFPSLDWSKWEVERGRQEMEESWLAYDGWIDTPDFDDEPGAGDYGDWSEHYPITAH